MNIMNSPTDSMNSPADSMNRPRLHVLVGLTCGYDNITLTYNYYAIAMYLPNNNWFIKNGLITLNNTIIIFHPITIP